MLQNKKKILFQDTSFRDGFQSVFGARVLTKDFIPAVEAARDAGIRHFEAGGGARFQSLFLYCGESAFDMMDAFRKAAGPDANLQTLARGINVVALSAQPRDMIDLHAKLFKKHGITHIRNFDALNDYRNLDYSGRSIKSAGLHHQVCITLMDLPPGCSGAHDAAFYIKTLREILDSGIPFDSICFKDASGTANPSKVYETIKEARAIVGKDVILWHHTHDTASIGISQYLASIQAGIDGICLARAPLSGGTSQPDLISMWHALKGTDFELDIDIEKILKANEVTRDCLKDYFFPPEALAISPEVLLSPMPGGALTANTMMMRDTNTLHLYPKVIEAMGECVARGGFGTSVTPVSQFYFQQAFANVTLGPWKKITDGYGYMVLGYFGKTPTEPDLEIIKLAEEQLGKARFTGDPLDLLKPGIPRAEETLRKEGLPITEENIFILGAMETPGSNKGLSFLKGDFKVEVRYDKQEKKVETPTQNATKPSANSSEEKYVVSVNGRNYQVAVAPDTGQIVCLTPRSAIFSRASTPTPRAATSSEQKPVPTPPTPKSSGNVGGSETPVLSKLPGKVLKLSVSVGDSVVQGQTLLTVEAMKMEMPINAPRAGKITAIAVSAGQVIESGQNLITLD